MKFSKRDFNIKASTSDDDNDMHNPGMQAVINHTFYGFNNSSCDQGELFQLLTESPSAISTIKSTVVH